MDDPAPSASSTQSTMSKHAERMKRLRELHAKRVSLQLIKINLPIRDILWKLCD